jgi:hypothetical protein
MWWFSWKVAFKVWKCWTPTKGLDLKNGRDLMDSNLDCKGLNYMLCKRVLQFCDVTRLVIIHKPIWLLTRYEGKNIWTSLYVTGYPTWPIYTNLMILTDIFKILFIFRHLKKIIAFAGDIHAEAWRAQHADLLHSYGQQTMYKLNKFLLFSGSRRRSTKFCFLRICTCTCRWRRRFRLLLPENQESHLLISGVNSVA